MSVRSVTVQLPEILYRQAQETAAAKSLSIEEVLAQSIALSLPTLEDDLPLDLRSELSSLMLLGDDELWAIARNEMHEAAQDRLETLLAFHEIRALSPAEEAEYKTLISESENLILKKAEAYRLLTRRGYSISWINE
jgi:hypothetical protein